MAPTPGNRRRHPGQKPTFLIEQPARSIVGESHANPMVQLKSCDWSEPSIAAISIEPGRRRSWTVLYPLPLSSPSCTHTFKWLRSSLLVAVSPGSLLLTLSSSVAQAFCCSTSKGAQICFLSFLWEELIVLQLHGWKLNEGYFGN